MLYIRRGCRPVEHGEYGGLVVVVVRFGCIHLYLPIGGGVEAVGSQ